VSILDRTCFANFDEPSQELAIQPGETSLTRGKTWKSSVNLPRSNLERSSSAVKTAFVQLLNSLER